MNGMTRFSFLIRPDERAALRRLAWVSDRSQGATLRRLIRETAKAHGLLPTHTDRQQASQPDADRQGGQNVQT
jgi:hypothetical protein